MIFKINLAYNIKPGTDPQIKTPTPQELTYEFVAQAVNKKHPNGLGAELRRMWARVQTKFDTAIDANAESIELETTEREFIERAFNEATFHPTSAKYVGILESEIGSWHVEKKP